MPTSRFLAKLSQRSAKPIYIIRIAGLGDETFGQYSFCSRMPDYAQRDPALRGAYKDILVNIPSLINASLDYLMGGIAKRNVISFEILDVQEYPNDPGLMTRLSPTDEEPFDTLRPGTYISNTPYLFPLLDIQGTVLSPDSSQYYVGQLLFMNSEVMKITRVLNLNPTTDAPFLRASRGQLGTSPAVMNAINSPVGIYLRNNALLKRSVKLLMTFDGLSQQDEFELDNGYSINGYSTSAASFSFTANTEEALLDQQICSGRMIKGRVAGDGLTAFNGLAGYHQGPAALTITTRNVSNDDFNNADIWSDVFDATLNPTFKDTFISIGDGDEVISGYFREPTVFQTWERGVFSTGKLNVHDNSTYKIDNKDFTEAFTTRIESTFALIVGNTGAFMTHDVGGCSFRYQSKGAENPVRDTTWNMTSHPVLVMLCLICSSKDDIGAIQLQNYTPGKGNFSGMRIGVGLGIPAEKVDFDSFWAVYEAMPTAKMSELVISKPMKFSEWAVQEILQPFGLNLSIVDGLLTLRRWRSGIGTFVAGTDITINDIVIDTKTGKPQITHQRQLKDVISRVTYNIEQHNGEKTSFNFNASDFPTIYGGADISDGKTVEINLKSMSVNDIEGNVSILDRVVELLHRFRRPIDNVKFTTDFRFFANGLGDIFFMTCPNLVDYRRGTRGWVDKPLEVIGKQLNLDKGTIEWTCIAHMSQKYRATPPSAWVNAHAPGSSTVTPERFKFSTSTTAFGQPPDADTKPPSDASHFQPGDVVMLKRPNGVRISPTTTETVVSINDDGTLTLSGDFGGATMTNNIITWADATAAITDTQMERGLYMGTRSASSVSSAKSIEHGRLGTSLMEKEW